MIGELEIFNGTEMAHKNPNWNRTIQFTAFFLHSSGSGKKGATGKAEHLKHRVCFVNGGRGKIRGSQDKTPKENGLILYFLVYMVLYISMCVCVCGFVEVLC